VKRSVEIDREAARALGLGGPWGGAEAEPTCRSGGGGMCLTDPARGGEAWREAPGVKRPLRNHLPVEHGLTLFSVMKCSLQLNLALRAPLHPCIHVAGRRALRARRFAHNSWAAAGAGSQPQMNVPSAMCNVLIRHQKSEGVCVGGGLWEVCAVFECMMHVWCACCAVCCTCVRWHVCIVVVGGRLRVSSV
jgi:hypothetical protein